MAYQTVAGRMSKIKGALEQRMKQNNTNIDLSTAENWLIREELVDICKGAIADRLQPAVS
jgi:hypothetical protein